MKTLSKSRFVSGVQCEKKLWYSYYRKDLQLPTDEQTQAIFDLGHQIGNLAQNRFPNGKDATPEDFSDFSPSIEKNQTMDCRRGRNHLRSYFNRKKCTLYA